MSFGTWMRPANRGSSVVTVLVALNVAIYFLDSTSGGQLTERYAMQP